MVQDLTVLVEMQEDTFDEDSYCQDCRFCTLTRDSYGTGDSPETRECEVDDVIDCPGVMERLSELEYSRREF